MDTLPAPPTAPRKSPLQRLLAEPMLWFVLAGAALFAADAAWRPPASREIRVTAPDMERLRALAVKQYGAQPDAQRLQALVRNFIREEVLYREALALGMDREDEIVRKRLVQKMEYLAQGSAEIPDEAAARRWYAGHGASYASGQQLAFEHILFSERRAGASASQAAQEALRQIHAGRPAPAGDASMLAREQPPQSEAELARDFGAGFAAALADLPAGQWVGPLASPLGQHLVRVTQRRAAAVPAFAEVRQRVLADLAGAELQAARDRAYERARSQYHIVLDAGLQ